MTAPAIVPTEFGNLAWLDDKHPEYVRREAAWQREERRMAGQDAVLRGTTPELVPFNGEDRSGVHFRQRLAEAVYINLPREHASLVTGHLSRQRPTPGKGLEFGALGPVRPLNEVDVPTRAEMVWYNIDGVGNDGTAMDAWLDGVDIRAQATGHRWLMVEAPPIEARSYLDELNGARPYAVEFSPLEVPNWEHSLGRLDWAIVRVRTTRRTLNTNGRLGMDDRLGYYLLVRQGCEDLGPVFTEGGWWTFSPDKDFIAHNTWAQTRGQIPMFPYFGRIGYGTAGERDMSQSDTMELGQLAIEMMNTRSARKYDFWDACASRLYFLGADQNVMRVVVEGWQDSALVAVPPKELDDGTVAQVSVYDGSTGTVAADVADRLETSQWRLARELSLSKVTSEPGSSGESKDAGFTEANSPELARRAALRESAENTLLMFFELRFGFTTPRAFAIWPREYDLAPLVEDIDAMFDTLRRANVSSPTLEREMIIQSARERRVLTDATLEKTIRTELEEAAKLKEAEREADAALFRNPGAKAGDPLTGAAAASAGGGVATNDDGTARPPRNDNDE